MLTEDRCHLFWAPLAVPLALLGALLIAGGAAIDRHLTRRTTRARPR